ncbi:hydroxyacid dehydrogenase [Microvirga lotononidis]|uniref:Phosphoglycerate dehydrogenase-like oxidoreductase n=1 Tax=Microvirga lotononidis TaxID=864069 RepID=I4YL01_9HYPH|nr:hydroxyacid dehydrogenase [Microvirga lotononidis]EIM24643.1 phosphoglycerate dehydrogenase-like oxidoreductase [Microvirga lotononidis]WQO26657.1 hydroxyacid dehydrogenase [Microvirga lotononidis]
MTGLQKIAFAMDPVRTEGVLTPPLLDRLARSGTILSPEPLRTFTQGHALEILRQTEILVTGWGCPAIGRDILELAPNLRLIAHAAGTVKGFLSADVIEAGIAVTHAAEANAVPVAEFTLAAILFANKQVFRFRDIYCADRNRSRTFPMTAQPLGNFHRTIGIVGASRIGRRVIELLKPFAFRVLLHDPYVDASEAAALRVESVSLDDLMRRSDVVSIHAPALPSTQGMIDRRHLALMRDGATFINTARGIIVEQDDLIDELRTGRIDAIIDVTFPEVPEKSSALYDLPNVFLTPHIAGAIGNERERLGEYIVEEIERFMDGRPLRSAITAKALETMA